MKFRKGFVSAFVLIVFFSADLYGQDCVSPKEALPDIMQESGDLKVFSGVSPEEAEVAAQRVFWLLLGSVAGVVLMLILLAYFFEKSASAESYSPTEVKRGANFKPFVRSGRKSKSVRYFLDE